MSKKRKRHFSEFKAKPVAESMVNSSLPTATGHKNHLALLRQMEGQYFKAPQYGSRSYAT